VKRNQKSTYKRVVLRRLDHGLTKGFVDPTSYLSTNGIRILDREGRALTVPFNEIKGLFFVRDFEGNPQRSERKLFQSRPRMAGLWVRMVFKDREVLEGLLPNNLVDLSPEGFLVTPADVYSNNLRVFVPRSALSEMTVLGVISDGRLRKLPKKATRLQGGIIITEGQIELFPAAEREEEQQP